MTVALLVCVLVLGGVAVREYGRNRPLRERIRSMQAGTVEAGTGLLSESAIPLRLIPELEWAGRLHRRVALVVIRPYGGRRIGATGAMRSIMRGYENAFRYGERDVLISFWDVDPHGAVVACSRLVEQLERHGGALADAGIALYPDDGTAVDDLVRTARGRMRPIQRFIAYAAPWRGKAPQVQSALGMPG